MHLRGRLVIGDKHVNPCKVMHMDTKEGRRWEEMGGEGRIRRSFYHCIGWPHQTGVQMKSCQI